jgi:hypothetical protein
MENANAVAHPSVDRHPRYLRRRIRHLRFDAIGRTEAVMPMFMWIEILMELTKSAV